MIEIHSLGWKGDHAIGDGEEPSVSLYARVFVDGVEIPQVVRVRTRHDNDSFGMTVIMLAGAVEVVNHTQESWDALDDRPPSAPHPRPPASSM